MNNSTFDIFPIIYTERLKLRKLKSDDAVEIFRIRSNIEAMRYMDRDKHESIKDSEALLEIDRAAYTSQTGINWGITEKNSDSLLGYVGFWRIFAEHFRAEVGYALNVEHWNKGIMSEALNAIIKFGFEKMNLHSIEANLNPDNTQSIKLLKRLGFKQEAYFRENYHFNGKFIDSVIFSLLESDYTNRQN